MAEQLANLDTSTLDGAHDDSTTTITVADGSGFPATGTFRIVIDPEGADELCTVSARSGNALTVTRGAEGTSAAAHASGVDVAVVLTAAGLEAVLSEGIEAASIHDLSDVQSGGNDDDILRMDASMTEGGTIDLTGVGITGNATGTEENVRVADSVTCRVYSGQYIDFDFGSAKRVWKVRCNSKYPYPARSWTFWWSDDDSVWTQVAATITAGNIGDGNTNDVTYTLDDVSQNHRYWRVKCADSNTYIDNFVFTETDAEVEWVAEALNIDALDDMETTDGSEGDVMTQQADGSFAPDTPTSLVTVQDESGDTSESDVATIRVPDGALAVNGTGDVSLREVPSGVIGASVYMDGASQSVANATWAAVSFDAEHYDSDSLHDNSTNPTRLTVPAGMGGKWLIIANGGWASNATGARHLRIHKNGSAGWLATNNDLWKTTGGAAVNGHGPQVIAAVDLEAGDYLEMYVYQTSGGALDLRYYETRFEMVKLGSGTVGETIGAKAYATSVQTLTTGTWTDVDLDTEDWDTDGFHSTASATDEFTIPAGLAGKYLCIGYCWFDADAAGGRNMQWAVNGTAVSGRVQEATPDGTNKTAMACISELDLAVGDVVTLQVYQNSGGNLGIGHATERAVQSEVSISLQATQGASVSRETDYTEITSGASITATSEATADTVVTAGAITADGSQEYLIEFVSPYLTTPSSQTLVVVLYDGSSSIGKLTMAEDILRVPCHAARRLTPDAGEHTYSIRAYVTSGTGTVNAGAGGSGNLMPSFIRISKA